MNHETCEIEETYESIVSKHFGESLLSLRNRKALVLNLSNNKKYFFLGFRDEEDEFAVAIGSLDSAEVTLVHYSNLIVV